MKKVTNSNTKAEILEVYQELLDSLKEERSQNISLKRQLDQKQKMVEKVQAEVKTDSSVSVRDLRAAFNTQLDELEEGIVREQGKFAELQQAIEAEKETLDELYKIKAEAESLDALLITNRQAKEKLETQMEERRLELLRGVEEEKTKWKREQEEYEYNLKIKRRDETDAYTLKKAKQEADLVEKKEVFEREIAEREQIVAGQEVEFKRLQKEVEQFEERISKEVENAEKVLEESLTREFKYQQELQTKDLQAQLQLHQQEIETLRAKVKEQNEFISALTTRTDTATQQVQDIAFKAIENAGLRNLTMQTNDRFKEDKPTE